MVHEEQDKKQQIKQSARELFFRFGFKKTSMDDIARQCSLAKPTLYYYYPNKESIFNDILLEEATGLFQRVLTTIPVDTKADQKIELFVQSMYSELDAYTKELENMPEMVCQSSPHGRPVFETIKSLIKDNFKVFIQQGSADGLFDVDDKELISKTLSGMFQFMTLDWMRETPASERERVVAACIKMILNGLIRRP